MNEEQGELVYTFAIAIDTMLAGSHHSRRNRVFPSQ